MLIARIIHEVTMTNMELHCFRCGHHWLRRDLSSEPKNCPYCKSPYWNRPRTKTISNEPTAEGTEHQNYTAKSKRVESSVPAVGCGRMEHYNPREIWEIIDRDIKERGLDVQVAAYINELLFPLSAYCLENKVPTIVTARELGKIMETMFQDFVQGAVAGGGNREMAEQIIQLVKDENQAEVEAFCRELEAKKASRARTES